MPVATVLGFTVPVAVDWRTRLLGLAFLDRDQAGQGLMIPNCRSVHTFGMRFPLDVVFLGEDGRVLELRHSVPSRRIERLAGAAAVLELPAPETFEDPR
jgi:uncharacterized membrane protein (UPF0127 family)